MLVNVEKYYDDLISCTSKVTGLTPEKILRSRERDAVDARNIIVYLLYKKGIYKNHISLLTGITRAGISYILSNFDNRKATSKYFVSVLQVIEKKLI